MSLPSLKALRRNLSLPLPASGGCHKSLVSLCLLQPNSNLRVCCHMLVCPLCAWVPLFSYKDTSDSIRAYSTPVWPHLNLTSYIGKVHFAKYGHIVRFQIGMHLGDTIKPSTIICDFILADRREDRILLAWVISSRFWEGLWGSHRAKNCGQPLEAESHLLLADSQQENRSLHFTSSRKWMLPMTRAWKKTKPQKWVQPTDPLIATLWDSERRPS